MAGYVKVWTSLRSNDGYLSLSGLYRGAYLQLLLWCKSQRDDGTITASGWTQVGVELGIDRRTSRHICDKLAALMLLTHDKNAQGIITIQIHNYKQWQEITVEEVIKKRRRGVQKCTPLRPDQTRLDQTTNTTADKPPDSVDEFVAKYREICESRGLKKVLIVNNSRRGKVRQRLKELAEAEVTVDEYMQKIANSPFLRGDRGNWGGADFDFIIGAQNIGKILDGKYDRRDSDIDWGNIGKDDEEE